MNIVGLDLGKRKTQICIQREDGSVIAELRVDTDRTRLAAALEQFLPARVLLEASTSSEWVARVLESIGCDVVVADPRFSLMYAQTDKKVKNDRRDARALAAALRLGAFRRAHRHSDAARELHGRMLVRQQLIRARTKLINLTRSLCEREGVKIAACHGEQFAEAMELVAFPDEWLGQMVLPLVAEITSLTAQIDQLSKELAALAKTDAVASNLQTIHGVGPITALTFISVVEDPKRFDTARQVTAYLGLVPSEFNSGDSKRRPGAITKSGDAMLRGYLVEAAYSLTRNLAPASPLKDWFNALVKRNGGRKNKAAVAVARRLARVMWAMWRSGTAYDPARTAKKTPTPVAKADAA
jgi:transposase